MPAMTTGMSAVMTTEGLTTPAAAIADPALAVP